MQESMGQYSTQAGDPAHPVQQSVITAISLGAFFGLSKRPFDMGSCFSGNTKVAVAIGLDSSISVQHYVHNHASHRNVHPDGPGPARNRPVPLDVPAQASNQR